MCVSIFVNMSQRYDVLKRMEHGFKSFFHGGSNVDISAVDPDTYAARFKAFILTTLVCSD